ncbi:hypothetical protein H9Y04_07300 [Streptomyces sp. TRM66268-LWL]|uniref:DUF6891 domain-containing protein n=1 Tax=Streptomyces polyasparticus TaxID=2767826 RepID=A0ABR7SD10_9ACTN|nr:hypothetical protein [Streptomyces polyasparticus]MBC9712376.1 hypothetical protein [Streptomyces polyasparticus]
MLAITVQTERGERFAQIDAERLGELVRRIGERGDRFLVLERIPELPDVFAQVWHERGGDYQVEYRDGGAERHFGVEVAEAGTVVAALTRWARDEREWGAGLDWRFVDLGTAPEPVPELALDEERRVQLEARIRELIVCGYHGRDSLTEVAEDYLVDGGDRPVTTAQARVLVDRLWRERADEQRSWSGTTDPERIRAAFAALEQRGITARENFTCCRTCADTEIGAEAADDARGYVYFHSQCTEGAAAGHGLMLLYGAFDGGGLSTVDVGREVVAALDGVGLASEWDGSPTRAVHVTPLDWRKRLGV